MYAYEICPKCGGLKWVQYDEYTDTDGTASPPSLKACDCRVEPEPKSEFMMTIACPHCGKYVTFEVRGDIKFDFGERKEL